MLALFVVCISTSILTLLIFFLSYPFCRNFICFQFHHSISLYQILYSPIWSSFFWFLIFFLGFFYKSSISFQLYHSIQIDGIIFFDLVLIIMISNFFLDSFVKIIILFNFTLQSKIFFYIKFNPYFFLFFWFFD